MVTNQTRYDRSTVALLVALAVDNIGSGLFLPLALLYPIRVVGLGVDTAGAVLASATLLGLVVPPLAARLNHRLGPRYVVVASQLLQGAGAVTYLLAGNAPAVFVAAALMAMGTQLFYCSVFVLVADVSTSAAKERPFARVGMVRAGAFGLGNLLAALALATHSAVALRWLVAADAVSFVVAAALLAGLVATAPVDHGLTEPAGPRTVLRDRRYLALMASTFLLGLATDFSLVGVPVYVIDVLDGPAWLPGALIATSTLLASVAGVRVVDALAGRRRTANLRLGSWIYLAWMALAVSLLRLPPALVVPVAFLAWVVLTAANKVFYPFSAALSEALPPRPRRAGYMATYQYAFTFSQAAAPGVVGLFAIAAWLPWATVAGCLLLALVVQGRLGRALPETVDRPLPVAA